MLGYSMKTVKLSKGVIKSISVYDPDICQSVRGPKRTPGEASESSCVIENKPIQHNAAHVRKRNQKILKTLGKLAVPHQCFLTLQSTISEPSLFRKNFEKFANWFKRKYDSGWMFYVFECSITGNIHAHAFIHLRSVELDIEQFNYKCWRKWSIINSNPDSRLSCISPFHVKQFGYVASKSKYGRSIALLNMFQNSQTFGFINKKNAQFIDQESYQVDGKISELINQFILAKINKYDFKMNRMPSYAQINKIIHFGAYSHHCLSIEEVACLNVMCNWEELIKLYGVADSSLFDDLPEWPSDFQLAPDDEEPIYGPGDEEALDAYQAILEEA